jgi:hypothetical protein
MRCLNDGRDDSDSSEDEDMQGSDGESGDDSNGGCNIERGIERAMKCNSNSKDEDVEVPKTSTFVARKKAYFDNLSALKQIKGVLYLECLADTTIPQSAWIQYEGNAFRKHLELHKG